MFGLSAASPQFGLSSLNPFKGSTDSISSLFSKAKGNLRDVVTSFSCANMPSNGTCAILFDEDDCDGWQLAVNEGYLELPDQTKTDLFGGTFVDRPKKDDTEAVLVREGCILVAYEETKEKEFNKGVAVAAVNGHKYEKFGDISDIDDDIKAVECHCGQFLDRKSVV